MSPDSVPRNRLNPELIEPTPGEHRNGWTPSRLTEHLKIMEGRIENRILGVMNGPDLPRMQVMNYSPLKWRR